MQQSDSLYNEEEYALQRDSRIRNLVWTISGEYDINYLPDAELFKKSKSMCLYDAIKQGAFAKYFDREALSIYMLKKMFLDADYLLLNSTTQMAVEAACRNKIEKERAGVEQIREAALEDMLEYDFKALSATPDGRMKLGLIRKYITGVNTAPKSIKAAIEKIASLENAKDTLEVIKTIDFIYNNYFDKDFEKKHGSFEDVMNVSLKELAEGDWTDFLKDEVYADNLQETIAQVSASVTNLSEDGSKKKTNAKTNVTYLDNEDIKKMNVHVENTFGKSYLSKAENERLNKTLCKGISSECKLHFTEGILATMEPMHYRYKYAEKQLGKNKLVYYDNHRVVKRNIAILSDILKNSLVMRSENEVSASDHGEVNVRKLWKIGRTNETKIFDKTIKRDTCDFVVDVLIDASGSQSSRQGKVALQAYILSEALSQLKIPHRIMSFCTFWEYTVLRRFRDYDSDRSQNAKIFEYMTSSNNRDGLAIKAVCESLLQRQEENKILIVLSDGRPNDINLNNPNAKTSILYTAQAAVNDTAREVRMARSHGISVLGVFAGEEDDLAAEKLIFGKDFAYIKNIANFSNVVGLYLVKQIEE